MHIRFLGFSNYNSFGDIYSAYSARIAEEKLGANVIINADLIYRSVNMLMKHLDFLVRCESIERNIK